MVFSCSVFRAGTHQNRLTILHVESGSNLASGVCARPAVGREVSLSGARFLLRGFTALASPNIIPPAGEIEHRSRSGDSLGRGSILGVAYVKLF